ncbi:hypothetical protein [Sporichthya polymorpha]|uniref:hypothetical protein n=1 Tax=Sporichthya polymorpha TaxID=35751 RepID=UPI00037ACD4B|nr:hypothetical protein [Sporichthya polymorpha]
MSVVERVVAATGCDPEASCLTIVADAEVLEVLAGFDAEPESSPLEEGSTAGGLGLICHQFVAGVVTVEPHSTLGLTSSLLRELSCGRRASSFCWTSDGERIISLAANGRMVVDAADIRSLYGAILIDGRPWDRPPATDDIVEHGLRLLERFVGVTVEQRGLVATSTHRVKMATPRVQSSASTPAPSPRTRLSMTALNEKDVEAIEEIAAHSSEWNVGTTAFTLHQMVELTHAAKSATEGGRRRAARCALEVAIEAVGLRDDEDVRAGIIELEAEHPEPSAATLRLVRRHTELPDDVDEPPSYHAFLALHHAFRASTVGGSLDVLWRAALTLSRSGATPDALDNLRQDALRSFVAIGPS